MSIEYTIKKIDEGFLIEYENGAKVNVSNVDLSEAKLKEIAVRSAEYAEIEKKQLELYTLRSLRNEEFSKFDKYQLMLFWEELSSEEKLEYRDWRKAWLDVTETLIEPKRPEWFV